MKILKKDLRHNMIVLQPENADDLWILSEILQKGDIVSGRTLRSIKIEHGDKSVAVRKSIFVKIAVEKIDFEGEHLRASGRIIESSEGERGWHAFEIMPDESVVIEREWKKYEVQRLESARVKHPKILVCVMDDSEADFFMLTEKLRHLASFRGVSGKSYGEEKKDRYYEDLIKYMRDKDCFRIIIAGPGFAKEGLVKIIKENEKELGKKIFADAVSHTGSAGMKEVLRRGIVEKIVMHSAVAEQTRLVEEFFLKLSKGEKVAYGKEQVRHAVSMGAVSLLLVSNKMARENEDMLKNAESMSTEIKIIYSSHEAGERLLALGGFAAFLRYEIRQD
ncbi:MAG: mRNA surveillance protein pelota [Candidatus Aenigmarchaeota archaeon]|nr:mRNA surveillance protein pelota [Candidatus Aenigmarchaeota archaeon]MDI6722220.1 mRNA surveillance protein pelota [Candidatus Aenigmarchaeota archaeon]